MQRNAGACSSEKATLFEHELGSENARLKTAQELVVQPIAPASGNAPDHAQRMGAKTGALSLGQQ
jgi:hypothetical protein